MKFSKATRILFPLLLLLIFAAPLATCLGANAPTIEERLARLESVNASASAINTGDNAWLLVSSALVLMMTAPGLILF